MLRHATFPSTAPTDSIPRGYGIKEILRSVQRLACTGMEQLAVIEPRDAAFRRGAPAGGRVQFSQTAARLCYRAMKDENEGGAVNAHERLFASLYEELHRVAERQLRGNAAITVSPTTLLHETYLNMASRDPSSFKDREHFMAYASRAMRGLLIDRLRSRASQKRGGEFEHTPLATEAGNAHAELLELEPIHAALERLGQSHPRLAELVDLKFFCGFSFDEIAGLLNLSARTVKRDWEKARLLLYRFVEQAPHP
jgi:RNA polymerase sigma factor (TIGR02999 family)